MQTESTSNLRFSVREVLVHLSSYMTLEPGDVIHFGTSFQAANPEKFPTIRHIDISRLDGVMAIEIEGVGRLENPIARA